MRYKRRKVIIKCCNGETNRFVPALPWDAYIQTHTPKHYFQHMPTIIKNKVDQFYFKEINEAHQSSAENLTLVQN